MSNREEVHAYCGGFANQNYWCPLNIIFPVSRLFMNQCLDDASSRLPELGKAVFLKKFICPALASVFRFWFITSARRGRGDRRNEDLISKKKI